MMRERARGSRTFTRNGHVAIFRSLVKRGRIEGAPSGDSARCRLRICRAERVDAEGAEGDAKQLCVPSLRWSEVLRRGSELPAHERSLRDQGPQSPLARFAMPRGYAARSRELRGYP